MGAVQPAPEATETTLPVAPKPGGGNLSAAAAADYLGGAPITGGTLMTLARRNKIGHIKIGRATMFPVSALDAYIEAHTVAPQANPWDLTDSALARVRGDRPARVRRAS